MIGEVSDDRYNEFLMNSMRSDCDEVLTIHAEAEGMSKSRMFESFLDDVIASGREIVPLGEMVDEDAAMPTHRIEQRTMTGREGWLAVVST